MSGTFYPPTREGHRRPYARNASQISINRARRNRHTPTIPGLIARYERKRRATSAKEGRAA